jgi:predicted outer membrane lipoprotein
MLVLIMILVLLIHEYMMVLLILGLVIIVCDFSVVDNLSLEHMLILDYLLLVMMDGKIS